MKFKNLLILLSILTILLNSCSSLSEAGKVMRNEKSGKTDEFLIKKKGPLTQPPDFEVIPEPGSIVKNTEPEKNNIKKILNKAQSKPSNNQSKSSSTEESILNQIKK
jgi:PBP1b-binding outer membrane lipoprotein LpoB